MHCHCDSLGTANGSHSGVCGVRKRMETHICTPRPYVQLIFFWCRPLIRQGLSRRVEFLAMDIHIAPARPADRAARWHGLCNATGLGRASHGNATASLAPCDHGSQVRGQWPNLSSYAYVLDPCLPW